MIHSFPYEFTFEEPVQFTDPFRYAPHSAVREAARLVIKRIESDAALAADFSEGKMLGVLVCRRPDCAGSEAQNVIAGSEAQNIIARSEAQNVIARSEATWQSPRYIAAFSGNVGGKSTIDGFVPPIYDLLNPDGEFKRREAEITELNHKIERLLDSDRLLCLERELADAIRGSETELAAMKEVMAVSKSRRGQMRSECSDPDILDRLIRESQHEKAEYRRLKKVLDGVVSRAQERISAFHSEIEALKKQRAAMSESLQDWIFRQYIVHNATGESASIADIFASDGLVPPGGTGECAAPKLLEYAYRNGLEPLAMGEFWYGRSPETAVRTHGHFYPSCTSKCGPLLGYMMRGMSSPSADHSATGQSGQADPIVIYEDEAVIVVEKPSGMPSVPGLDGRLSLLEWLSSVMSNEQSKSRHLHAVHRLDMDTSGVMVFAKTAEAAVNLRHQFEEHTIRKTYMALVADYSAFSGGTLPNGSVSLPLSPDYDERPRQKVDFKQGKEAYTEYEVVKENPDGTADLLLHPLTGRTHQLRVHCAHTLGLGRPIIGDLLYGSYSIHDDRPHSRLCLHALSITFTHPLSGKETTFASQSLAY